MVVGESTVRESRTERHETKITFLSTHRDWKYLRSAQLVVFDGTDRGRTLTIEKERVTIGRSSGCDLTLVAPSVSFIHAEVITTTDGYLLRDLDSTNGIFMLGHRVREVYLRPGSEFQIGANRVRFQPLDTVVGIPLSLHERFGRALGRSVKMRALFALLEKVAVSELPILLRGETGTGKELLATGVHTYSMRKNRPFVVFDCAAVPPDLIEDLLFGHEKGAFTGASNFRRGIFEQANGGTLFIDEIGELCLDLQPKLLRVLELQQVQRIGSVKPIDVNVRIIAATHRDLWSMAGKKLFREDLLYRFSVVEVFVPPLRERPEDIPLLAECFLRQGNKVRQKLGFEPVTLSEEALAFLQSHYWPGNVREFRNAIERAVHLVETPYILRKDLALDPYGSNPQQALKVDCQVPFKEAKAQVVKQFEREYLIELIQQEKGNLSAASRKAELARQHLRKLCRDCGISVGQNR